MAEVRQAWERGESREIEDEFGDLLFSLVNTSRFLNIDSETALRRSVDKFERRFRALEEIARTKGQQIDQLSLEELNAIWDEVKALEQRSGEGSKTQR